MEGSRIEAQIRAAARVIARAGLVTAFGHVSARSSPSRFLITPPVALGALDDATPLLAVSLEEPELPAGAPGETWLHWAIYRARPKLGAICRGQPPSANPLSALGGLLRPIHGQGAWLGARLPIYDDPTLVRSREAGERLAASLGAEEALLLRGNGAVAVGASAPEAATRLWLLEDTARVILQARATGQPLGLSDDEIAAWRRAAPELISRLWRYLAETYQEHL